MLLSQMFKIVFVLIAVSGAMIYKLANIALSRLLLPTHTSPTNQA